MSSKEGAVCHVMQCVRVRLGDLEICATVVIVFIFYCFTDVPEVTWHG